MLLGILSDTHGNVDTCRRALTMLESLGVEELVHCGDIGSEEIPPLLAAWPTQYVFGNCDYDHLALQIAIEKAGGTCHGLFGSFEREGIQVAVLHSHEAKRFRETCNSGTYDLVVYGHTHQAEQHEVGSTLVLNPGALHRASRYSVAVVELPGRTAQIITVP